MLSKRFFNNTAENTLDGYSGVNFILYAFTILVFTGLQWFTFDHSLFWDSIYYSGYMPLWYYENDFKYVFMPDISGQYPFHGMYVALWWMLFGKSLVITRLSMLPLTIGVLYQLYLLGKKFIPQKYLAFCFLVLVTDPAVMTQSIMVSHDYTLLFFFLLCINTLLANNYRLLTISSLGLGLIHIRGSAALGSVFFIHILIHLLDKKWKIRALNYKTFVCYLPAFAAIIVWQIWQYKEKGWWICGPDGREFAGWKEFAVNFAVISRNFIDTGRIIVWIVFFMLIKQIIKALPEDKKLSQLVIIFLVSALVMSLFTSLITFIGHRYFMHCYLALALLLFYVIVNYVKEKLRLILISSILVILVSGNFWVYPDSVSKGWDSTLAHLPYYKLRNEMISYIKEQNINPLDIGTGFPNYKSVAQIDLSKTENWHFNNKDLDKDKYQFYSNIFNDYSDEELRKLKAEWEAVKTLKSGQVKVILYKKL